MSQATPTINESPSSKPASRKTETGSEHTVIDGVLQRLDPLVLPAKDHFAAYLRHKWRMHHKTRTMNSSFTSIMLFLDFYGRSGKGDIRDIERSDLEAFIEHEQDRGMYISTVRTRMASIIAFLHFLMEQEIIPGTFLKKRIRLKLPDTLPRAMNPNDVKKLIQIIDNTRDRALILLLLRTGMRIGEVLGLTMNDIDLNDRKVHLFEGEKNSMGRVVYLSNDVLFSLKRWCGIRNTEEPHLFPGKHHGPLCYSAARSRFIHYIKKARLEHKGYTIHSCRHTFASELLNAGMRLEVLQQLLGHQDIEVTRRYARLTDKTREEEYFRAMAIIEKGGIDGDY
ncbi:MAG: tyrosine-type recombinase/integrase [Deltaproteobacteria bacterium]|nr:tyrosine-type recombinase/integrase [Deltaproteobacteria bacterium]